MTANPIRPPVGGNKVSSAKQGHKDREDRTGVAPMRDIRAIAHRLDVSEKTVRRLIARGELHAYRIGRQLRISEKDFLHFLGRTVK